MMLHPTGIRILKKSVNTIGLEAKSQNVSRRKSKLTRLGEPRIPVGSWHILPYQGRYEKGDWTEIHASDVEKQSQSLITRITTNLLRLCGFANHVTSNGIKN